VRRIAGIFVLLLAAGVVVVLGGGAASEERGNEFKVELDNAFGLVEGADFKVAGVRAGQLKSFDVHPESKRAIVSFEITETGFGSLREDVTCEVMPQSLVGEYFVNCQPGRSERLLPEGATIPVERTSSTVPPDLVNNVMRRPYRERFGLIISSLGAAVAGNGENLNAALRRAAPALRETNRVLAILARQNQVIADLARDADQVIGELAENRTDVSRWVVEARDTAAISAERDRDIAGNFRRLPTFLRELRPTMTQLGRMVDEQGPALRNLSASAGQLERLFRNLPEFADASRPGIRAFGEAAKVGREAVRRARPTVAELERYSRGTPELGKNLAIVLEHLDDRRFSVEEDPRSPGGQGYTGLEALLQYVFDQTMATNVHDGRTHILKAFPFENECAHYADIARAREHWDECSAAAGPNAIGINFPDTTAPPGGWDGRDRGGPEEQLQEMPMPLPLPRSRRSGADEPDEREADTRAEESSAQRGSPSRAAGARPSGSVRLPSLDKLLPGAQEPSEPGQDPAAPSAREQADRRLLDFLLGS
jgi:ABC-type transporter Mla subunit MlaD